MTNYEGICHEIHHAAQYADLEQIGSDSFAFIARDDVSLALEFSAIASGLTGSSLPQSNKDKEGLWEATKKTLNENYNCREDYGKVSCQTAQELLKSHHAKPESRKLMRYTLERLNTLGILHLALGEKDLKGANSSK